MLENVEIVEKKKREKKKKKAGGCVQNETTVAVCLVYIGRDIYMYSVWSVWRRVVVVAMVFLLVEDFHHCSVAGFY